MRRCFNVRLISLSALALIAALASTFTGCTVAQLAGSDQGTDLTAIQPGITRAQAEAVLGTALKEWKSAPGVIYRMYQYDAGRPPLIGDAVAFGIMDVISLGAIEAFAAYGNLTDDPHSLKKYMDARRTTARVVISYDERDIVLGVFDEFEELPADGRSGPRKSAS